MLHKAQSHRAEHATVLSCCTTHCTACSVDGLGKLMQTILDAKKSAADEAAATQAATKPSAVDAALQQAGQSAAAAAANSAGAGGSMPVTAKTLEAAAANGANTLDLSVRLLAGMRWAGLDQLDAARGKAKKLVVYR